MKKTGKMKQELLMAAPRIAFALVLAITISKPLETRLFNSTIERKLAANEDAYNADCESKFNKRRDTLDKKKIELEQQLQKAKSDIYLQDPVIGTIEKTKNEKNADIENWQGQINNNLTIIKNNTSLVTRRAKNGKIFKKWELNSLGRAKKEENKQLNEFLSAGREDINAINDSSNSRHSNLAAQVNQIERAYTEQISGVQRQINDLNADRPGIIAKCKADAGSQKDLLDRLEVLGSLKKFGNTVWFSSLFITLLFILLETAPVTVKIIAKRGPYDLLLESVESDISDSEKKKRALIELEMQNTINDAREASDMNKEFRLRVEEEKLKIELNANKELLEKIAEKQADLTEIIIAEWYAEQLAKVKNNQAGTSI